MKSNFMEVFAENLARELREVASWETDDGKVFTLRGDQRNSLSRVADLIEEGHRRITVERISATGKTALKLAIARASRSVRERIESNGLDMIVTTERTGRKNVAKALKTACMPYERIARKRVRAKEFPRALPLVGTISALTRNIDDIQTKIARDAMHLVLGDECDLIATDKQQAALDQLGDNVLRIGFTATAGEGKVRKRTEKVWGDIFEDLDYDRALANGGVTPFIGYMFSSEVLTEKLIPALRGDEDVEAIGQAMKEVEIQRIIANLYRIFVPEGEEKQFPSMVVLPTAGLVPIVVKFFNEKFGDKVKVAGWNGKITSDAKMEKDTAAYNNGEIDVLVVCEMGGRCLDLPRARVMFDFFPTQSLRKKKQRDMRVGRIHDDKEFAILVQALCTKGGINYNKTFLDAFAEGNRDYRPGEYVVKPPGTNKKPRVKTELRRYRKSIGHFIDRLNEDSKFDFTLVHGSDLGVDKNCLRADKEGKFPKDGEIYGSLYYWAGVFGYTYATLRSKIKEDKQGVKAIDGFNASNAFYLAAFYPESEMRRIFGEGVPKKILRVGTDNDLKVGGKRCLTAGKAWRILRGEGVIIAKATLDKLLSGAGPEVVRYEGLDRLNHVRTYYDEADIRRLAAGYIAKSTAANEGRDYFELEGCRVYFADEDNVLNVDGKKYFTIVGYLKSHECSMSQRALINKVAVAKLKPLKGTIASMSPKILQDCFDFYAEDELDTLSNNFQLERAELKQANDQGVIINDHGEVCRANKAWADLYGRNAGIFQECFDSADCEGFSGLTSANLITTFYSLSEFKAAWPLLLNPEGPTERDVNGFVFYEGKRYASIKSWTSYLPFISAQVLRQRIKNYSAIFKYIFPVSVHRDAGNLYCEEDVMIACEDLLPCADELGYFRAPARKMDGVLKVPEMEYASIGCLFQRFYDCFPDQFDDDEVARIFVSLCDRKNLIAIPGKLNDGGMVMDTFYPRLWLEEEGIFIEMLKELLVQQPITRLNQFNSFVSGALEFFTVLSPEGQQEISKATLKNLARVIGNIKLSGDKSHKDFARARARVLRILEGAFGDYESKVGAFEYAKVDKFSLTQARV